MPMFVVKYIVIQIKSLGYGSINSVLRQTPTNKYQYQRSFYLFLFLKKSSKSKWYTNVTQITRYVKIMIH